MDRGLVAIAIFIGLYSCVDALTLGVTSGSQYAFLAMAIGTAAVATSRLVDNTRRPIPTALIAWVALTVLCLAQSPFAVISSPLEPITDTIIATLVLAFYLALPPTPRKVTKLVVIYALIGVATVIPTLISWSMSGPGVRFDAPAIVTLAAPWSLMLTRREFPVPARLVTAIALMLLSVNFFLCLASRSRTALIVYGLMSLAFPLAWALRRRGHGIRRGFALLGFTAIVLTALSASSIAERMPGFLEQARLSEFASGNLDSSSEARLIEANDVLDTMKHEGTALNYVIGLGPGATYAATHRNSIINVDDNSRAHNIHITPMMLLFRYGVVGLLIFTILVAFALRGSIHAHKESPTTAIFFAVVIISYIIDSMARNSLSDPLFALTIAAGIIMGNDHAE